MPEVLHGQQNPAKDFATANIQLECERGVYLCRTNFGWGIGGCVVENQLEIHLVGFTGDIYGKNMEVLEMKPVNKHRLLAVALAINEN